MKRKVENWSLEKLLKERTRISFPEYQREKKLWSPEKKGLLIDTILEDIDIPKLYFNQTADGNYEVVDGQQRLWTIWEFLTGEFTYKGHKFAKLTKSQQDSIRKYNLQITVFEDANDAYLRKLFVRLQIALLLVTGEKLHALSGVMKDFVFGKMVSHAFIKALGIPTRRYAKQTLCAQICINSFMKAKPGVGTFATTRYENLQHFFQEYGQPQGQDKEFFQTRTDRIQTVMGELSKAFGARAAELTNRSYILSLYLFFEELLGDKDELPKAERKTFVEFAFRLWKRLREEAKKGFDRTNKELYTFGTYLSSAPTEKYQIERRHQKLREYYQYFTKTSGTIKGD
jgi:hypothetical protein